MPWKKETKRTGNEKHGKGSRARNILKAARSYGLTAKGYRYEPERLKENGKFPILSLLCKRTR